MRILVIEDETRLARVIARVLEQERFDVDVRHDGPSGLDAALTGSYDAIVLDRMLPGMDGLAVVRGLRQEGVATPVLMLTARGDLPERVEGLDAGADDYLGKPFAFEEVLARLRALLRRTGPALQPDIAGIGAVEVDFAARTVRKHGAEVELSPREFSLLETLARHRGQVLSRDQLLEQVWGYDSDPQGNVVDLYIHYLRKKLDDPGGESLIRTVRGAGYSVRGA
ncbi:MAG: response regulator transcription factor [Chloroflexota bacterium]